jgi:branched-subunit amino acid aminotransferase/4-amino-4-deoxychorismate lyase
MPNLYIHSGKLISDCPEQNPINYIGSPNIHSPFESIMLNDGVFPFWELHLNRIFSYLGKGDHFAFLNEGKLISDINMLLNHYEEKNGKIKLVFDSINHNYYIGFIAYNNTIEERMSNDISVLLSDDKLDELGLKAKCSLYNIQKKNISNNFNETLLLNNDNLIAEGLFSNFIFFKNKTLFHIDNGYCMLSGIMQKLLIEIAIDNNINCEAVKGLSVSELKTIDFCALCNSVQGFRIIDNIHSFYNDIEYSPGNTQLYDSISKRLLDKLSLDI